MKIMKSRAGSAVLVLFVVIALAAIGGIAYAHFVYLPKMAAQHNDVTASASSTPDTSSPLPTSTVTNTATTTPALKEQNTGSTSSAFSCSYDDGTYVGVTFLISAPPYIDPSLLVVPYSGGDNAIIKKDISANLFCVKVRKISVDTIFFQENKTNGATLFAVVINPLKDQQYTVDSRSTALGLTFISPYFFNSDPAKAQIIFGAIAKDPNIPSLAQYIQTTPDYINQIASSTSVTAMRTSIIESVLKALTASSTLPQASIRIISPNQGTVWKYSTTEQDTITWTYRGISSSAQAHIYLQLSNGNLCEMGSSPVGAGTFNTILGSQGCLGQTQKPNIVPGRYQIEIFIPGTNGNIIADAGSGFFSITQ